ncbi:MAG: hypothetical protein ABI600_03870 [Luteolibacter sp.]
MRLKTAFCYLALVSCLRAQTTTGDKLLDNVISHPGSYWQVCDIMTAPSDIPYRAFELSDFSGGAFSKANEALIGKNREPLVNALRARLLRIDFTRKPVLPGEDKKPEENSDGEAYGCDPKSLNPLLLDLIQKLHAIETLPELLAVEEKLVKGIAVAKDDADAAPPNVAGWCVAEIRGSSDTEDEAKRDRRNALFQARVAQRDLVMSMALLMREKSYEPFLKTSLEADYQKGLRAQAGKWKLPVVKESDPVPKEVDGAEVTLDPVTHLLRRDHSPVEISYSRESRDEVRAVANRWIEEHP